MADIDPGTGLEFFFYLGQKRYRCPAAWEAGGRCQFDHYDPQFVIDHSRGAHGSGIGDASKQIKRVSVSSSLVDASGNPISYESPDDPSVSGTHFKK